MLRAPSQAGADRARRHRSRWPPTPSSASSTEGVRWRPRTGSMGDVSPSPPTDPRAARSAPCCPCCATTRPSPTCAACAARWSPCPSRPGPSPWPAWPRPPAATRWWWPCRPTPTPSAWPTTWRRSSAPTRSRSARPGRPCPSSGSAPAWRPWAAACGPCGACASPGAAAGRGGARTQGAGGPGPVPAAAPRPPRRGARARWSSSQGDQIDPEELVARLVAMGYRREYQVEHRGRAGRAGLDRRRVRLDRRRPGAHRPVGRRGRPADRVLRRRPALDGRRRRGRAVRVPGAAARPRRSASGPPRWSARPLGPRAVGAPGRGPGLRRHGVLAAVADRPTSTSSSISSPPTPSCSWSSRGGCGTGPPSCSTRRPRWPPPWPRPGGPAGEEFPRLHLPFDRLLAHTDAAVLDRDRRPRGARDRAWSPPPAGIRWSATADRFVAQLRDLLGPGLPDRGLRRGPGQRRPPVGPARRARPRRPRSSRTPTPRRADQPGHPGGRPAARAGLPLPAAQAGRAGRGRPDRPAPGPPPAPAPGPQVETFFDDMKAGDYVVHYQHGVGRFGGMVRRAIGGVERDYLLLEYRGGDKLYVPSDQIDLLRPYTGGESPTLSRLNGTDWQRAKSRVRAAVARDRPGAGGPLPEAGQRPRPRLRPRHALAAGDGGGLPLHRDARPAQGHRGRQGRHGGRRRRWTGWSAATSASARPRWPSGPPSRPCRTASRWPCWCPTTLLASQHFQTFSDRFAGYPVRVEMLSRFLTPAQARKVVDGLADGSRRRGHRHPPAAVRRPQVQGPGPARRRRGAALRRQPQGEPSRSCAPTSTCSPSRPRPSPGPSR